MIHKKMAVVLAALMLVLSMPAGMAQDMSWAAEAVEYCLEKGIIHGMENGDLALDQNLTREQMAKMLVDAFDKLPEAVDEVENTEETEEIEEMPQESSFADVEDWRWSKDYIEAFKDYRKKKDTLFNPTEKVTREEFAASIVLISGLTEGNIRNRNILDFNFTDADQVDEDYKKLLSIAVERGYMKGDGGALYPKNLLTRAQACSLIYRMIEGNAGNIKLDLGVKQSETNMIGDAEVTLEQAKQWAESRGAHERFIAIADLYWQYGELSGIRPEILYAQAAKETGFGKYGGRVLPEQNNWAGIKTKTATGDETEDHETFPTPEDGVRGHFNHMSAYVGLEPIGEPHGRYYSVKSLTWAGTVETLEELGGKWCPDLYYGYSILHDFIEPMMNTQ